MGTAQGRRIGFSDGKVDRVITFTPYVRERVTGASNSHALKCAGTQTGKIQCFLNSRWFFTCIITTLSSGFIGRLSNPTFPRRNPALHSRRVRTRLGRFAHYLMFRRIGLDLAFTCVWCVSATTDIWFFSHCLVESDEFGSCDLIIKHLGQETICRSCTRNGRSKENYGCITLA